MQSFFEKTRPVLILVLGLLATTVNVAAKTAPSSAGTFGAGVVIGEPTGLSAKAWTSSTTAFDFGLAFSFDDYMLLFSDHLWHFPGAFGKSSAFVSQLYPYLGIGGVIAFTTDRYSRKERPFFKHRDRSIGLGVRIPAGIEWMTPKAPIGIFVELVPGISVVPATSGFIEGGIGARYYF